MGPQPHDGHIEGHWKGKTHVANSPLPRAGFVAAAGDFHLRQVVAVPLRTSKSIKLQDNTILNIGVPYAIPDTQQIRLAVGLSRTSRHCRTAAL